MKAIRKYDDVLAALFLVVVTLVCLGFMWVHASNAIVSEREAKIERIESKKAFLVSAEHEGVVILDTTWEGRGGSPLFSDSRAPHDVFTVHTDSDNLARLLVFDTQLNEQYVVEPLVTDN